MVALSMDNAVATELRKENNIKPNIATAFNADGNVERSKPSWRYKNDGMINRLSAVMAVTAMSQDSSDERRKARTSSSRPSSYPAPLNQTIATNSTSSSTSAASPRTSPRQMVIPLAVRHVVAQTDGQQVMTEWIQVTRA